MGGNHPAVRLYQGDCLDVMPCLEAGSIDMVLCDLPYGTTQSKWDAVIPFEPLWAQFDRLCRGPIVLFAAQPFTSALVMSNPRAFRHEWIWEKNKASGHLNAKRRPMLAHESVLVFGDASLYQPQGLTATARSSARPAKGASRGESYGSQRNDYEATGLASFPRSVQRFPVVQRPHHPNQKPTAWLEYLLRTYSLPGAVVLDATMGSGSTGVACVNTGRQFVGIERDPDYFAGAQRRIRSAEHARLAPCPEPAPDLFAEAAE